MVQFQENIPLSKHGSYKIGGPARFFFEAVTREEVAEAIRKAKEQNLPVFILGGGTNLLISDNGFNGLVLKMSLRELRAEESNIYAGAGVLMNELLDFAAEKGLTGLEWAGGLPGTVGGAIRGNAGAFGGETKDSIFKVESFDTAHMGFRERGREKCRFGYRASVFKERGGEEIVLGAVFHLAPGEPEKISLATQEKIDYRNARHPMEYPNIGSIFKNVPLSYFFSENSPEFKEALRKSAVSLRKSAVPVKEDPFPVVPSAYLISEANMKGRRHGSAVVSPKHPNFIVNDGGAMSADVEELIRQVKRAVREEFGVTLEEEVQRL
jgi:UDP-N-acetylmuramate dehydrogenase